MTLEADVVKAVEACRSDLNRVVDELKWALTTGLESATALDDTDDHDLHADVIHPGDVIDAALAQPIADLVPGARWALDIGDYRLRQAFLAGVGHLATAEVRTTTALYELGHRAQPQLTRPSEHSTVHAFDTCRTTMLWRFDRIERDAPIAPRSKLKLAARHLQGNYRRDETPSARQALDIAFRELTSAFARGKTDVATAEPMCIICAIRPRADRKRRCDTCATWKTRNKRERPTSLDEQVIGAARDAQDRRAARGEGFGVA